MSDKFVKIRFTVYCEWQGIAPEYRIYVNDELFTQRTYNIPRDKRIKEMLQIESSPGMYTIKLEAVGPQVNEFTISNTYCEYGPATIINNNTFEIL